MPIDSSEKYKLLLQNSSAGNKFLRWDFKVHIRFRSSSTAIRPLEASVDPSVCPIDPKGSIPTTLATPDIHALLYATVAEKLRSARAEGIERVVKICSSTDTFRSSLRESDNCCGSQKTALAERRISWLLSEQRPRAQAISVARHLITKRSEELHKLLPNGTGKAAAQIALPHQRYRLGYFIAVMSVVQFTRSRHLKRKVVFEGYSYVFDKAADAKEL
ncbi:hypothetical protein T4D_2738 [Trichinella pseudospiralis]|uniref:Uncharacterized protein n=1 Tax=Trichinella pseudospiralis TaxID=6337 RepID=A0A0V1FPY8_TRIPS|nr:hypothetical protein T4D_2738 [Trichinella pseudospiralis]